MMVWQTFHLVALILGPLVFDFPLGRAPRIHQRLPTVHLIHTPVEERSRKQKFSDLRTSPGPLWRLHTWFDLFRYRLVAQREVESMTIGGADPRS